MDREKKDDDLTLNEENQEVFEEIEENNREDAVDNNSDYMQELKEESESMDE